MAITPAEPGRTFTPAFDLRVMTSDAWNLPGDAAVVATGEALIRDSPLDLDVVVYPTTGTYTDDGATPRDYGGASECDYTASFVEVETGATYRFQAPAAGYAADLPAGVYAAWFEHRAMSSDAWSPNSSPILAGECLAVGP